MADPGPGDPAPSFQLPDHTGTERALDELLDGPLVLWFYPGDFTPFCTREACEFRDALPDLHDVDARVVGISADPPEKHAAFREKHELPFMLLSDEEGEAIEAFGADGFLGTRRVTFLIDSQGVIRERITSLLPGTHIKRSLATLTADPA